MLFRPVLATPGLAGAALAALVLTGLALTPTAATGEGACPDLSTGRQQPPAGTLFVDVTAPSGWRIDQFCTVSPGRPGPDYAFLDPLVPDVRLSTPTDEPIVEYSVSYVLAVPSTSIDIAPAPATVTAPSAAPAAGRAPGDRSLTH